MKQFSLPQLRWYGRKSLDINFPDNWKVDYLLPRGADKKPLTDSEIVSSLRNPIGTEPLRELARGSKEVAIIFDDFTRITPVGEIALHILDELHAAGVVDDQVRFICALGAHGAHDMNMLRKKLGDDIVRNYPVYNHNCYENCTQVGVTSQGTPIKLNNEYLDCDLRIGIGGISPHVQTGFGGGGKIILPGISHIDAITYFHTVVEERNAEHLGLGNYKGNLMNKDFSEAVVIGKLDFKVDAIFNLQGDICKLFAGDPTAEYLEGCSYAIDHYATPPSVGNDVAIVNAYGKANEMAIAGLIALSCIKIEKAIVVFVYNAPEGQITHYLFRSFGKRYGGKRYQYKEKFLETIKLVSFTEYPDRTSTDWFVDPREVEFVTTWDDVLKMISDAFPDGGKAVVVPDGTMQYFRA